MKKLENGIHYGVSWDDYEAIDRERWSELRFFELSAAHYRQAKLTRKEKTDALIRGMATHRFTFEPDRARASFCVWDLGPRRGKDWEAFKKRAQDNGTEILTDDMYQQAMNISQAARSNPLSAPYLNGGGGEVSLLWTYDRPEMDGVPAIEFDCKSRLDFLKPSAAIVDLKTTRCAKPAKFGADCVRYGYAGQAAFYTDAYFSLTGERLPYVIIAIEPEPPYAVVPFRVPERIIQYGRDIYRGYLYQLAMCRSTNLYPAYSSEVVELALPEWALPRDEDATGLGLVMEEVDAA